MLKIKKTKKRIINNSSKLYVPNLSTIMNGDECRTLISVISSLFIKKADDLDEKALIKKRLPIALNEDKYLELIDDYVSERKIEISSSALETDRAIKNEFIYCVRECKWDMVEYNTNFCTHQVNMLQGHHILYNDDSSRLDFTVGKFNSKTKDIYAIMPHIAYWQERDKRRDMMIKVVCKNDQPPIKNNLVLHSLEIYNHLEIIIFPLVLNLDLPLYHSIRNYFFPELSQEEHLELTKNFLGGLKNERVTIQNTTTTSLDTLNDNSKTVDDVNIPINYINYARINDVRIKASFHHHLKSLTFENLTLKITPFVVHQQTLTWNQFVRALEQHVQSRIIHDAKKNVLKRLFKSESVRNAEDNTTDASKNLARTLYNFLGKVIKDDKEINADDETVKSTLLFGKKK